MMSMNSILENNLLKVEVSSFGAELQSITSKASGYEYLWQGDPAFWKLWGTERSVYESVG